MYYVFLMCEGILPACMCVYHLHVWFLWRPEERSDILELELYMSVSCHVGTENRI